MDAVTTFGFACVGLCIIYLLENIQNELREMNARASAVSQQHSAQGE